MLKLIAVIFMLFACCYCLDNDLVSQESRAKKKKKSRAKLWALILLVVISKVAIMKIFSGVLFVAFFQKFCSIMGLVVNYFLKNQPAPITPSTTYGVPQDYNTLGYSYGPPEHETFTNQQELSSLTELAGSAFKWPFHRSVE